MAQKDNTLNVITHVLGLLTSWLGPLIVLLVTKDKTTKQHARKALNWQLSYMIYMIISFVLMFVLIGFLLIPIIAILDIVFCIMAAVKAGKNELWDYPLAIPFLK